MNNDFLDRASDLEMQQREDALAAVRSKVQAGGVSAEFCQMDNCGVEIPPARRAAVPGCMYCVNCQARRERGAMG